MSDISNLKHRELGLVAWYRNFDAAISEAAKSRRPILLLFQEIPGCATCVNFGRSVLGNPLLAAFIQEQFVPLAIFNNRQGHDADILRRFGEPAWNNPVVYFLDQSGTTLTVKLTDCYDALALYQKISMVLETLMQPLPDYADALQNDLVVGNGMSKVLYFATPCFWSGETSLAQHPAVLTTSAGWIDGEEVVRVDSASGATRINSLIEFALREGFTQIDGHRFERDSTPQYYLSKTPYARIPLTHAQRTKINLAIPYRDRPERFLSPPQSRWLGRQNLAEVSSSATYRRDFNKEWSRLQELDKILN